MTASSACSIEAFLLQLAESRRRHYLETGQCELWTVRELAQELGLSPARCLAVLSEQVDRGRLLVRIHRGAQLEISPVESLEADRG